MSKRDFYDRGYYAGLLPEPRFVKVLQIAGRLKGDRLLDIGCGDGTFTLQLSKAAGAKDVYGIEIAPEAVALLTQKGIKSYQLDIDEQIFPFENDYFDMVYCGEIIEHLFNPDHLLDEVYRVLKPGGCCILTTPNLAGWPNRLALMLGYQPFATAVSPEYESAGKLLIKSPQGQWGHIRVFTLRALKELLRIHKFKIKKVHGCPVTVNTKSRGFFSAIIKTGDSMMSVWPSMASRVILVIEKTELTGVRNG